MNEENIFEIQKVIFAWYKSQGRHTLPWRLTKDVYRIAIAEIMLQQTNVPKVVQKYEEFLKQFPTVEDLAYAEQSSVVRSWQGLGYNRRALYLHKMARAIVSDFDGAFPRNSEDLMSLPGIGPYTSRSVLIFAFNDDMPTCDVNINRILRRWHGLKEASQGEIEEWAEQFLPIGRSRDWHNALMDFASVICTKRAPKCNVCPLADVCRSYPDPGDFQIKKKKEVGRSEKGKHVPRRIFRGRIVECLRSNTGTVDEIGSVIKEDWNKKKDHKWCLEVLQGLEKDEMIACKNDVWMLL